MSGLTSERLAGLRAIADAYPPGILQSGSMGTSEADTELLYVRSPACSPLDAMTSGPDIGLFASPAVAKFVEQFDRETALAMLDRIAEALETIDRLRAVLATVDQWFAQATAPHDVGCDFLNEDGWGQADDIHAAVRAALNPEPPKP